MTQQNIPGIDPQVQRNCDQFRQDYQAVKAQIQRAIVCHECIIVCVLTCLFVGGHVQL